jgi:hypothetical protein
LKGGGFVWLPFVRFLAGLWVIGLGHRDHMAAEVEEENGRSSRVEL